MPIEIKAEAISDSAVDAVSILSIFGYFCANMPFGRPSLHRRFPETKVNHWKSIVAFIVQYSKCSFSIVHLLASFE